MAGNRKKRILLALILLNLTVIWGNSMLPGSVSGGMSTGFLQWLKEKLPVLEPLSGYVLRKIAHFTEFTCLGLLLAAYFRQRNMRGIHALTMPLLCGVLAANVDETIQLFSPGRASMLFDVWVDTAGVVMGITLLFLGYTIAKKRLERKQNK